MSTDYIPDGPLDFEALRTFRRGKVRIHNSERACVMLTDGTNCLAAYPAIPGWPIMFQRTGANDVSRIVRALENAFKVRLVPEHDVSTFETLLDQARRRGRKRTSHPTLARQDPRARRLVEPDFTPEDERLLDRIWDRIGEERKRARSRLKKEADV